jgi:hypothetical protein
MGRSGWTLTLMDENLRRISRMDLGAVSLESHRLDGGREGPSSILGSTNCDEHSNTAKLYHGL